MSEAFFAALTSKEQGERPGKAGDAVERQERLYGIVGCIGIAEELARLLGGGGDLLRATRIELTGMDLHKPHRNDVAAFKG